MVSSNVSAPPSGSGSGVGVGGNCDDRISLKLGASKPANSYSTPWQALLEQKEELSVPPGLDVVWQFSHVSSKTWWCRLIQFSFKCDYGSGPRLISMSATKSYGPATIGIEWHRLHSRRIAAPSPLRCFPSWQRKQPGESLCPTLLG